MAAFQPKAEKEDLPPIIVEKWPESVPLSQREAVKAAIKNSVALVASMMEDDSDFLGVYQAFKRESYPRHLVFRVTDFSVAGVLVRIRCAGDKCLRMPATPQQAFY